MRVISPKLLRRFWTAHPDSRRPLAAWLKVTRAADWNSFADLKRTIGGRVDRYNQFFIFDIGGNKYRLIAAIHFNTGVVFVRHVLTHTEYDLDKWKES